MKSYLISGPKPTEVSQETHDAAQAWVPRLLEIFSDPTKTRDWYFRVEPDVYDETMRILNFNEPYYIIDNLISKQEEGGLEIPKSAKICDLGCGTGIIGRHLAKNGYTNIFGIDGSKNVLQKS